MKTPFDKNHMQLTEEDFDYDSWFSLIDVLQKPGVSIGLLATFIEKKGIKTFDQVGRLISVTDGERRDPTSKACVLNLLTIYYAELRDCRNLPPKVHPSQDPDRWLQYESPLNDFGWPKNEVPGDSDDFAEWIANPTLENETNSSITMEDTNPNDPEDEATQTPPASPSANEKLDNDKKLSDSEHEESSSVTIKITNPNNLKKQVIQTPNTSSLEQTNLQTSNSQDTEVPQSITNWRMRIQAQAAIIWCKHKNLNCSPTKLSINPELAKWCRNNNVTTDYGIWPSETYIYRHVTRKWDPPKC